MDSEINSVNHSWRSDCTLLQMRSRLMAQLTRVLALMS